MEVAGTPDNNKQTERNLYFDADANRRIQVYKATRIN